MEGAPELEPEQPRRGPDRRHLQGGGAEPQPVHLRRRGERPRGHVRQRDASRPRTSWAWGRRFQLSAQSGRRTKNYQIALTEPYLFDRPITAGFDIFNRKLDYETIDNVVGYSQRGHGRQRHDRATRGPLHRACTRTTRTRSSTSRVCESLVTPDPTHGPASLRPLLPGRGRPAPGEPLQPVLRPQHRGQPVHAAQRREVHGLTPQFAGGPLGGTAQLLQAGRWRPSSTSRTRGSTALGLRARRPTSRPFGDTTKLPYYQRFFLGGETQIRGVQHPRPWARSTTSNQRPGRQQVRPLQRRVLLRRRRPAAGCCSSSTPARRSWREQKHPPQASSARRPASRCGSSCPCSTCRSG